MLEILVYSLLIMLASVVGVLAVWKQLGATLDRNLHFLVSFSAGVFLIVTYELGQEVLGHTNGLLWILVGAIFILFIFKLFPFFHHHHDTEEGHTHSYIDTRRILVGDGIHNIADGILLATAFSVNSSLGMITAASIFVHELVQETSEFFILRQAGYTIKRALYVNFLFSSTILIGAIGGMFLLENFAMFELPLLGISAGAFLVVILHDLIPHSVRTSNTRVHHIKHIVWFLIGVVLMVSINAVTTDSHGQDIESHDGHDHVHEEV